MRVGVLALQGGTAPHLQALRALGHEAIEVRSAGELAAAEGLVLPGGESGAQLRLLDRHGLWSPLAEYAASGRPVLATCAGLVLAARYVVSPEQRSFGWLDVTVARNAWGRQLDSFEATADDGTPLVFIRAPRIRHVGPAVEVLLRWDGEPILVRQRNVTAATFHPELTPSLHIHRRVFESASAQALPLQPLEIANVPEAFVQNPPNRSDRSVSAGALYEEVYEGSDFSGLDS